MLAGLPYVVWPVGSLFVLASRKKDDPFLHYHAVQGGLFGAVIAVACLLGVIALAITFRLLPGSYYVSGMLGMGTLLGGGVVAMTIFFTAIFLGWRATEGEMLRLPFLGDYAEGKMLDHTGMTRRDFEKMLEESFIEPTPEEFEPIPFPAYGTPALTGKAAEVMAARTAESSTPAAQKAAEILAHRQARQAAAQQAEVAQREAAEKAHAALLVSQKAANLAAQQAAALQAAQQAILGQAGQASQLTQGVQPAQAGQAHSLTAQAAQAARQVVANQASQMGQAARQAVTNQATQAAQRAVQKVAGQTPAPDAPAQARQAPPSPSSAARPSAPSNAAAQRPPQASPQAAQGGAARPTAPADGQARSYSLIRDSAPAAAPTAGQPRPPASSAQAAGQQRPSAPSAPAASQQHAASPAPSRPTPQPTLPPTGAPRAPGGAPTPAAPEGQVKDLDLVQHYRERKKPTGDALRQWLQDQDA